MRLKIQTQCLRCHPKTQGRSFGPSFIQRIKTKPEIKASFLDKIIATTILCVETLRQLGKDLYLQFPKATEDHQSGLPIPLQWVHSFFLWLYSKHSILELPVPCFCELLWLWGSLLSLDKPELSWTHFHLIKSFLYSSKEKTQGPWWRSMLEVVEEFFEHNCEDWLTIGLPILSWKTSCFLGSEAAKHCLLYTKNMLQNQYHLQVKPLCSNAIKYYQFLLPSEDCSL